MFCFSIEEHTGSVRDDRRNFFFLVIIFSFENVKIFPAIAFISDGIATNYVST